MILLFFSFYWAPAFAAPDSARAVILSPRVGVVLDKDERARFHLFLSVTNFHSAEFFLASDSSFFCRMTTGTPDGELNDTIIAFSKTRLLVMSDVIDHFEEIQEGRYVIGSAPSRLIIGGEMVYEKIATPPSWPAPPPPRTYPVRRQLPLAEPVGRKPDEMEYAILFGIALDKPVLGLSSFEEPFRLMENSFAAKGYPVQGVPASFERPDGVLYSLSFRVWSAISLTFEVLPEPGDGDFRIGFITALAEYRYFIDDPGHLSLQGSLGIAGYKVATQRVYGGIGNRISPIDSSGRYSYLDFVSIDGSTFGPVVGGSIVISPMNYFMIEFFARCAFPAAIETTVADYGAVRLSFYDVQVGVRLKLGVF